MITKVLIAEDHESANISIQKTLDELGVRHIDYVYYCDDAIAEIKKAQQSGKSYDLLVTDLNFEEDHRAQELRSGSALIAKAREIQPDLKVLVFSADQKELTIKMLIDQLEVDGYVRKARNDAKELKMAIEHISQNRTYFPRQVLQLIHRSNAHEFTEFDIAVIELLAQGVRQKDIPTFLAEKKIQPSGLSSVEKRLNYIREQLDCTNNEQLGAFCKDKGVI